MTKWLEAKGWKPRSGDKQVNQAEDDRIFSIETSPWLWAPGKGGGTTAVPAVREYVM